MKIIESQPPDAGPAWIRVLLKAPPACLALSAALLFDLDKIFFPRYALIRMHDTFDIAFPFLRTLAANIHAYGFNSQFPQILCGATAYMMGGFLNFLLLPYLVLPPYAAYVFISTAVVFVAFLGMYLLLRDGFKLGAPACAAGALMFSCLDILAMPEGFSIGAVPLLVWALENVFIGPALIRRLGSYAFTLLYFAGSFFVIAAPPAAFFYAVYFVFVSKIPKSPRNIALMALVWLQYPLFNLPIISEFFTLGPKSHRTSWQTLDAAGWGTAFRDLASSLFSMGFNGFMPLLGVLILVYYLANEKRGRISRETAFIMYLTAGLAVFSFWFVNTPPWLAMKNCVGFLKSFQFERLGLLLNFSVPAALAAACDFLAKNERRISSRRAWRIAAVCSAVYVLAAVYFNGLDLPFVTLKFWEAHRTHTILANCQRFSVFVQFLPVLLFVYLAGKKNADLSAAQLILAPWLLFALLGTVNNRLYWQTNNRLNTYHNTFESEQIDAVKKMENGSLSGFRVVSSGGYDTAPLNSGFYCADGYAMLYPQTYKDYWAKLLEPEIGRTEMERKYFIGWGNRVYLFNWTLDAAERDGLPFNNSLLKLIGVKYMFAPERILRPDKLGFKEVAASETMQPAGADLKPARSSKVYRQLKKIAADYLNKKRLWVYKNKESAGLAFLTGGVLEFRDKTSLLEALSKAEYHKLLSNSFVYAGGRSADGWKDLDKTGVRILAAEYAPDTVKIGIRNPHPVILNVTRNYNRGWRCDIDGSPAEVFRNYHSFMGVKVPSGSRNVRLWMDNGRLISVYKGSFAVLLFINLILLSFLWLWSRGEHRS